MPFISPSEAFLMASHIASNEAVLQIMESLSNTEKELQTKLTDFYRVMCRWNNIDYTEPVLTEKEIYATNHTPISAETESKKTTRAPDTGVRGLSGFSKFELMNFIDSGFSILDIQGSISRQFGKVDVERVIDFYEELERKGIVKVIGK